MALALHGDPKGTPDQSFGHDITIPSPYTRRALRFTRPFLTEKPQSGVEIRRVVNLLMIFSLLSILLDPIETGQKPGRIYLATP